MSRKRIPAMDPDSRENQLASLAIDLAERKLRDGTASNQLIIHYLKAVSSKERIEKEKLEIEKELMAAKREAIKAAERQDLMYKEAINAMRSYSGQNSIDDEDDDEYDY